MNKLKATILSLSLVTVIAGAAASPALGAIGLYFQSANPLLIKLIVTLPCLFIVVTSLFFSIISDKISAKHIAILGLLLYIIGGCGAGIVNSIYLLLIFRAVLGIGVGLIMPLSIGLISYYFEKAEQAKLMGYSSAMNNLGGILAMILAGYLVSINWRYSFAVYLLALLPLIFVVLFLPNADLNKSDNKVNKKTIKKIYPYVISMFIVMVIFYALPSNFSIIATNEGIIPSSLIGMIMAVQTLGAFLAGMKLSLAIKILKKNTKYAAGILLVLGFTILSLTTNMIMMIIGMLCIGFGLGISVPLLNSQVSLNIDKEETASAMAIMTSMLYLGQFLSPLIIQLVQNTLNIDSIRFPFYAATVISMILLIGFKKVQIQ